MPTALTERGVTAFPENRERHALMTDSPATVEPKQLCDLHIELKGKPPTLPKA